MTYLRLEPEIQWHGIAVRYRTCRSPWRPAEVNLQQAGVRVTWPAGTSKPLAHRRDFINLFMFLLSIVMWIARKV